jgi:hypothetical protein
MGVLAGVVVAGTVGSVLTVAGGTVAGGVSIVVLAGASIEGAVVSGAGTSFLHAASKVMQATEISSVFISTSPR